MSRHIRIAVAICGCLLSSGCAHYYRVSSIIKDGNLPNADGTSFYDPKTHQIDTQSATFQAALRAAQQAPADRNSLVSKIMLLSDDLCLKHKADIEATAIAVNLSLGTMTTLFSTAGSVLGAESTAKALSAAAAAANSSRSLVNEEVYQKAFAISILQAIDKDRQAKRESITRGLARPNADYPIETALLDVSQYHASCSFISGVAIISEAVGNRPLPRVSIEARIASLRSQMKENDQRLSGDSANASVYQRSNAQLQTEIDALSRDLARARE